MNITIVPIDLSHVDGFHKVVDTIARERKYLPAFEAPPLSSTRDFIKMCVETEQSQFVALDGLDVVGWCDIRSRSDDVIRQHVGVVGMGLLSNYRRRGLGHRLLSTTLEDSLRHGFRRIELKVRASNKGAVRLYEKFGFHHEGTLKDDIYVDGRYDSTLCMAYFPKNADGQPAIG